MRASKEMFPAILDPFDRPIEARRGKRNQNVLRINVALNAETAADVGQDASDTPFFHAEHGCGDAPRGMRPLTRCPYGQFAANRIRARQDARVSNGTPV